MSYLETLESVRELLTPPDAWTKGELARDVKGAEVGPRSERAVCWCIQGAFRHIEKTTFAHDWYQCAESFTRTCTELYPAIAKRADHSAWRINDAPEFTHDMLLSVLDHMIANEKETAVNV